MFGIDSASLLVVAGIGLLVLGPQQLKQVVRFVAKCVRSVRNILGSLTDYLESTIDEKK